VLKAEPSHHHKASFLNSVSCREKSKHFVCTVASGKGVEPWGQRLHRPAPHASCVHMSIALPHLARSRRQLAMATRRIALPRLGPRAGDRGQVGAHEWLRRQGLGAEWSHGSANGSKERDQEDDEGVQPPSETTSGGGGLGLGGGRSRWRRRW
jgi:hypothetical protein